VVSPFIRALIDALPLWLLLGPLFILGMSLLRDLSSFVIGTGSKAQGGNPGG
jgi:hypothetical protein